MAHENFMSKTDDVVWLAYQLKNKLGDKISINKMGLYKEVLEGIYNLNGRSFYEGGSIYFGILYSDKEFLRIFVGEIGTSLSSYEDKVFVLNELKNAISSIIRDDVSLGEPSVFYNVRDEEYMIPHLEYVYADKENYIKSFQDKTIFDDGGVPEDVIIFDITKNNEEFGIAKSYSYITPDTQCRYSIGIYAMVKNKTDIEEREIRNLIIENLDELFNNFNESLLESYVTSNNDITYITAYIKNALSLVEEVELSINIKRNGKEIHNIRYVNGHLVKYESNSRLFEYNMNTNYSKKDGIKFETKCDVDAYDLIEDVVRNELQNINGLKNTSEQYNVKSNNNLLKLVRRMGNK